MRTAGIHGISAAFLEFRQAEFSTFVERHVESVLYFLWKRVCSGESCAAPAVEKASCGNKKNRNRGTRQADPTERSWRGVLRGHVPSKSLSADSEIPRAHTSGHTEKVGEKSDSFSRAERTRPLRPVSRLLFFHFGNVPVERFQRIFHDKKIGKIRLPFQGRLVFSNAL